MIIAHGGLKLGGKWIKSVLGLLIVIIVDGKMVIVVTSDCTIVCKWTSNKHQFENKYWQLKEIHVFWSVDVETMPVMEYDNALKPNGGLYMSSIDKLPGYGQLQVTYTLQQLTYSRMSLVGQLRCSHLLNLAVRHVYLHQFGQ